MLRKKKKCYSDDNDDSDALIEEFNYETWVRVTNDPLQEKLLAVTVEGCTAQYTVNSCGTCVTVVTESLNSVGKRAWGNIVFNLSAKQLHRQLLLAVAL